MMKVWQAIAIGVLGVAACQWLSLGDHIVHAVILILKTGWDTPTLTAGTGTLKLFLSLSAVAVFLGWLVAKRLKDASPAFARCARVATYSLVGGAGLWLLLIASPIVDLVQR